ncbi:MAG: hypothetical protein MUF07_02655 [Steroidobacteraceae bacterium]|nr:hypothetical protein [Steroidobacteraceae bacterium]
MSLSLVVLLALAPIPGRAAGWQEAVFSVSDVARLEAFLVGVGGWRREATGTLAPAERELWRLPPGVGGRYVLLRAPDSPRGSVRLVQFDDAASLTPLRAEARTWEPGGIGGLNVRIRSFEALLPAFRRAGFQGHSAPVRFTLQEFTVIEAMLTDPDGITLTPLQRVAPPLEGWSLGDGLSRPFNAFEVVADFGRAMRFYEDGLGFRSLRDEAGPLGPAGPNIFGLPWDEMPRVTRRLRWLHPDGAGASDGTLAVMAFDGARGAQHARSATPHALGIVALRLPVPDAAAATDVGEGCRAAGMTAGRDP